MNIFSPGHNKLILFHVSYDPDVTRFLAKQLCEHPPHFARFDMLQRIDLKLTIRPLRIGAGR